VCRGIDVRKGAEHSRPTAFDSGKPPDLAETEVIALSEKIGASV